ncbi:MAG: TolC family protein [Verrucomicrobia bacterium]|nr:MAG: TolC family protein [Verrucomicrobiota bacterium]
MRSRPVHGPFADCRGFRPFRGFARLARPRHASGRRHGPCARPVVPVSVKNSVSSGSQSRPFRRLAIVWAAALAFLAGAPGLRAESAAAATAPPPALSAPIGLGEARRIAFERNWDLLAAKSDVDIAVAQQIVARSFPNPILALSVAKVPADNAPSSTAMGNSLLHRSYDTIAAVNQLVEIGGKRDARRSSARAGIAGAEARFAEARRQLELAVTRAYVAVLSADGQATVLRASAASLRREADIAETRLKAGDLSRADRDQIRIAADRFEIDANRAEGDARTARIQLGVLLGESSASGGIRLSDMLEQLAGRPVPSGWEIPSPSVVANRPDVLAARADARRAEAELRLQKAQRVPDPTLLAQYEREPPDKANSVGLGVSFPLPLWNRNRGPIAAATAAAAQADTRANQTVAAAVANWMAAANDYRTAAERRERYLTRIVRDSAAVLDSVRFAYQKGGASLLDLLTAQRNDNDVRLASANAAADLANAVGGLEAAMSTPVPGPPGSKPISRP